MKNVFYFSLLCCLYSNFCLFESQFTGLEVDYNVFWSSISKSRQDAALATLFAIRCLTNFMLLILFTLSLDRIYDLWQHYIDVRFMCMLIGLFMFGLHLFLLFSTAFSIAYGALIWVLSAQFAVASFYLSIESDTQTGLKPIDHFIALRK